MKTKNEIRNLVVALAEVYGKELSKERAMLYVEAVHEVLLGQDLKQAFVTITQSCEFFPTPFQLVQLFRPNHESTAANFVDRMILAFKGPVAEFAGLGREGYYLAKDVLGVTRHDFQQGIKPDMLRKQWIETLTRHMENTPVATKVALEASKMPMPRAIPGKQDSQEDAEKLSKLTRIVSKASENLEM